MGRPTCIPVFFAAALAAVLPPPAGAAIEEVEPTAAWTVALAAQDAVPGAGLLAVAGVSEAPSARAQAFDAALTPELGVWLIVRRTNAMRDRDAFEALDSNLESLALLPSELPAPVPLPASAWLLVTGLLGFVGARLSRSRATAGPVRAVGGDPAPA